jgi:hypothetical protein
MSARAIVVIAGGLLASVAMYAQRGGFRGGGGIYVPPDARTAREVHTRSTGTPEWTNPPGFKSDVFTFVRLQYDMGTRPTYRARGSWMTDLPDADLNLSYRLQLMTSLRVDPDARFLRATDPELANYPFLFVAAPGAMGLTKQEIAALRHYLQSGGFILMTDFWGEPEWEYVEGLFREIAPESRFEELPITHPLYRSVFYIREKAQVPNIHVGMKVPNTQIHHRVLMDPKGRLMVMALHNSDDSDGWEREGENHDYFEKYSEKIAYPLAINIVFYVMTH